MPEAAIDEHGQLQDREDEVGVSEAAVLHSPAAHASVRQDSCEPAFSRCIATRPHLRHVVRTLLRCVAIHDQVVQAWNVAVVFRSVVTQPLLCIPFSATSVD